MGAYLRAKFQVSCIILRSFRHDEGWELGGGVGWVYFYPVPSHSPTHISKETPKKPA